MIEEIHDKLKEKYGPAHQAMDNNEVRLHRIEAHNNLARDYTLFRKRPSAKNWNQLLESMSYYQYWSSKVIYEEVEE